MLQGDQLTIADSEDRLNFTRDKPRNAFCNPLSKVHLVQFSVHNLKFHMLPLDEPRVLGLRENFIFPHSGIFMDGAGTRWFTITAHVSLPCAAQRPSLARFVASCERGFTRHASIAVRRRMRRSGGLERRDAEFW